MPPSELQFYGPDSYRANLVYRSFVDITVVEKFSGDTERVIFGELNQDNQDEILEVIKYQTKFLIGTFTYQERPTDFYSYSAGIDESPDLLVNNIVFLKKQKALRVFYEYTDRGVFYKDLFEEGKDEANISFYLPKNPRNFYKRLEKFRFRKHPKAKHLIVPCTSEEDNSEEALYYYWSPDRQGCPRSEIMQDLVQVNGTITKEASTDKTFPRYAELYKNRTKKNPLRATVVYGVDEAMHMQSDLSRLAWDIDSEKISHWPHLIATRFSENEEHAKYLNTYQFDWGFAQIRLLLVDPDSDYFARRVSELLQSEDILVYAGHSAEGAYFDLQNLYPNRQGFLLPDKYQVFFLNACTTYSYYHRTFFAEKSNNNLGLDLVLNTIGASFLSQREANYRERLGPEALLISYLLGLDKHGRRLKELRSWQDILDTVYQRSGFEDSALTVLLGDENNPTELEEALNEQSQL